MTVPRDPTRLAAGALLRGDAIAGAHLVVADGPERGRAIPLGTEQTLGRGPRADLRLRDPSASRLHVRLLRDGDRFLAEDLGSKNGLRVNGRRCRRRRPLRPGDELTIGETRLLLTRGILDEETAGAAAVAAAPAGVERSGKTPRSAAIPLAAVAALAALASILLALP
jgi:pSer/pThr/pTyr-binding forkhead associated (FHA) protein